jgi:hypothetical protein
MPQDIAPPRPSSCMIPSRDHLETGLAPRARGAHCETQAQNCSQSIHLAPSLLMQPANAPLARRRCRKIRRHQKCSERIALHRRVNRGRAPLFFLISARSADGPARLPLGRRESGRRLETRSFPFGHVRSTLANLWLRASEDSKFVTGRIFARISGPLRADWFKPTLPPAHHAGPGNRPHRAPLTFKS